MGSYTEGRKPSDGFSSDYYRIVNSFFLIVVPVILCVLFMQTELIRVDESLRNTCKQRTC